MFSSFKQGKRRKGGKSSKWHQRLLTMWDSCKYCFYCGVETIIENRTNNGTTDQVDNAATLDHVYSNLDLRRLLRGGDKVVLSCYRCNNKRSAMEVRKVYPNNYDKRNNRVSIINLLNSEQSFYPVQIIENKK